MLARGAQRLVRGVACGAALVCVSQAFVVPNAVTSQHMRSVRDAPAASELAQQGMSVRCGRRVRECAVNMMAGGTRRDVLRMPSSEPMVSDHVRNSARRQSAETRIWSVCVRENEVMGSVYVVQLGSASVYWVCCSFLAVFVAPMFIPFGSNCSSCTGPARCPPLGSYLAQSVRMLCCTPVHAKRGHRLCPQQSHTHPLAGNTAQQSVKSGSTNSLHDQYSTTNSPVQAASATKLSTLVPHA